MSTTPICEPHSTTLRQLFLQLFIAAKPHIVQSAVRRKPTKSQGRALEVLGHAIEYLIDSSLQRNCSCPDEHRKAAQILMRLNREVFTECRK